MCAIVHCVILAKDHGPFTCAEKCRERSKAGQFACPQLEFQKSLDFNAPRAVLAHKISMEIQVSCLSEAEDGNGVKLTDAAAKLAAEVSQAVDAQPCTLLRGVMWTGKVPTFVELSALLWNQRFRCRASFLEVSANCV